MKLPLTATAAPEDRLEAADEEEAADDDEAADEAAEDEAPEEAADEEEAPVLDAALEAALEAALDPALLEPPAAAAAPAAAVSELTLAKPGNPVMKDEYAAVGNLSVSAFKSVALLAELANAIKEAGYTAGFAAM